MQRLVGHGADGEVDGAVDFAKAGAALALPCGVNDGEQSQRSRRDAGIAVAVAQRKLHHVVVEPALQAEPFVVDVACGKRRGGEGKRLGGWR
ncbi:hypothetical protein ES707_07439 [subsurface metagenome]